MKQVILAGLLLGLLCSASMSRGEWKSHAVLVLNGRAQAIRQPGLFQIVTERLNRVVAVPYLAYLPEKDRLLMQVGCDYPHHSMIMASDDHGATWSQPKLIYADAAGAPDIDLGTSLTYLGGGKVVLVAGRHGKNWQAPYNVYFSSDSGDTWGNPTPMPKAAGGLDMNIWDTFHVDRDAKTGRVERLIVGGYLMDMARYNGIASPGFSSGGLRVSRDGGRTWEDFIRVPQWSGASEITFARAANGNLIAACRTDWPEWFRKQNFDHYDGLAVSISKDNGITWSPLDRLYAWGRHHPSLVTLTNGDVVMTYVVRMGYPNTVEGFPQFGVEAISSHDNGATWDLDHRYILARWRGITKGPNAWYASSQGTSTLQMPDGSLLTAFGTGYRALDPSGQGQPKPRDIGLVSWRVSNEPHNADRRITDAPWDSDLRNEFNPDPERRKVQSECPAAPGRRNIAVPEEGARATTSPGDGPPEYLLHDPYAQPVLTLETLPAEVEIRWPKAHRIDEIHVLPGAPEWASRPSSECVPLDYRLQYEKAGQWVDLVPPVANAKRARDFYGNTRSYLIQDREFEYIHKFPGVRAKRIRMQITRSSDTGIRPGSDGKVAVPDVKRETALRSIEVFEVR